MKSSLVNNLENADDLNNIITTNYNQLLKHLIDNFTNTIEYFGDKHTIHNIELQNSVNEMKLFKRDLESIQTENNRIINECLRLKLDINLLSVSLDEIKQLLNSIDVRSNKNIISIQENNEEIEKCKKQQQKSLDYTNRRLNEIEETVKNKRCCII